MFIAPSVCSGCRRQQNWHNQCLTIGAPYEVISDTYFQIWRESNDDYFSAGSEMHSKKKLSV